MRRPSDLDTSRLPGFFSAARAEAAAGTSDARISPPEPEPRTVERSMPLSFARRLALGEILALHDAAGGKAVGGWDDSVFARDPARAARPVDTLSRGGTSPGATKIGRASC